jgi:hypothetical protein
MKKVAVNSIPELSTQSIQISLTVSLKNVVKLKESDGKNLFKINVFKSWICRNKTDYFTTVYHASINEEMLQKRFIEDKRTQDMRS